MYKKLIDLCASGELGQLHGHVPNVSPPLGVTRGPQHGRSWVLTWADLVLGWLHWTSPQAVVATLPLKRMGWAP